MHFFKSPNSLDAQSCQSIFDATKKLFEMILSRETPHAFSSACPCFVILAALMGASLLLRLLRGPFYIFVDQEHGSRLYVAMVEFLKSCSIEKGDSPDRGAALAENLWKSDKLFKNSNGSLDIALRVRNKFASSPMADLVLRWEDELSNSEITTESISNRGEP
jgi:transcriptional regulatory protein LEU3